MDIRAGVFVETLRIGGRLKCWLRATLFYRRLLLSFLCVFGLVVHTSGQDAAVTELVIIGIRHNPGYLYNSDSLLKTMRDLRPDVFLIEEDSLSYSFKKGAFRPVPGGKLFLARVFRGFRLAVEDSALYRYRREFPGVVIKPYDVMYNGHDRVKFVKEFLDLEKEFETAMTLAYERQEMSDYQSSVHEARDGLYDYMKRIFNGPLQGFNTDSTSEVIRQLSALENVHYRALVDSVPSLQRFAARVNAHLLSWRQRDDVMVQEIIRYSVEYPGKRIVVLTGALHRYFQLDQLSPVRDRYRFRLLDIYGRELTFPASMPPSQNAMPAASGIPARWTSGWIREASLW